LWLPVWQTLDVAALAIAIGAFLALFRFKKSMLAVLGGSAAVGLIYYLLAYHQVMF
jgi:chromate transporter